MSKLVKSLEEAIRLSGLKDGMTISFHHHLRNGDYVAVMVMDTLARMGFRDLTVNASSVHDAHAPIVEHVKNHVITGIETNFMSGGAGREMSTGIMEKPIVFRTHGTRSGDIDRGASKIDVAFIAAPTSDDMGNCTGKIGKSACGSLGHAFSDAMYAKKTIIITDNLVPHPLSDYSIAETYVDYVVQVDSIGDAAGIASATLRITKDPIYLAIAEYTAKVIEYSGLLKDGFSFQTGGGGLSLATAKFLKDVMVEKKIRGSFGMGGITGLMVDLLESGCFECLMDAQCFDIRAVNSLRDNPRHSEISVSHYASPTAKSSLVDSLDVVVLGATQIDTDFNVNVHTDSNGYIIGGSGGHSDTAEGAKMSVIVSPLTRSRFSTVVDKVLYLSTPGSAIDVLVTQKGVAVNPARSDLKDRLTDAGLPVVDIHELKRMADDLIGVPEPIELGDKIVAKILYRDGSVIDNIRNVL